MLFPYLTVLSIGLLLSKLKILLLVLAIFFLTAVGVVSCISCNVSAIVGKGSVFNLFVKIVYSPVHLVLLLFAGGMLNPFLFFASWIPLVISAGLLAFSGLCNIGNCISLYRNKQCSLAKTIILSIMGFIYGLDIIGAVIQLITSFKKKA